MQSSSGLILTIEAHVSCLADDARLLHRKAVRGAAASNMRRTLAEIGQTLAELTKTPDHTLADQLRPRSPHGGADQ